MDLLTLKNIFKFLSTIGIALAFFFLLPIVTGMIYHEPMARFGWFDLLFLGVNAVIFALLYQHRLKMRIKIRS